nr:MFS transporter [Haemophilus paraphrohaemolyticus]
MLKILHMFEVPFYLVGLFKYIGAKITNFVNFPLNLIAYCEVRHIFFFINLLYSLQNSN